MNKLNYVALLLVFLALVQCHEQPTNTDIAKQIVISLRDSTLQSDTSLQRPPPLFYSGLNFIIDSSDFFYFHNKIDPPREDLYSKTPPLVGLTADNLIPVKYSNLATFIDSVGAQHYRSIKLVVIASLFDTVNMYQLRRLEALLPEQRKYYKMLRLATDEEINALYSKKTK